MSETSNRLEDLHPLFRLIAQRIIDQTNDQIAPSTIRPAVTFRTMSDQATAKAAGLSKVNLGWHQFGLALDVAVISESGAYITNGEDPRYRVFGDVAKANGCVWGGDWTKPDWDHCELHQGFTLAQLQAWLDSHRIATA